MSNETRWEQLMKLAKEYTDPWRVERGEQTPMGHIEEESETLEELLEALETDEVPRYAIFELYDSGEDNWYMEEGYHIALVKDHREIEDRVKMILKEDGVPTDSISVYDLDGNFKEVELSIALNPSVLVLDKD